MLSETSVQDAFLSMLQEHEVACYIFLTNGIKLTGYIVKFDAYCIELRNDHVSQTVYKHAISTVMPDLNKMPSGLAQILDKKN